MPSPDRSRLQRTVGLLEWRGGEDDLLRDVADAAEAWARRAAAPYGETGEVALGWWTNDPAVSAVLFWPERFASPVEALDAAVARAEARPATTLEDTGVLLISDDPISAVQMATLKDAFRLLRDVSPAAHAFTLAMTRSLILAPSVERPVFWSSSPERFLYASRLWNLDHADVEPAIVADALLHEAVHSWLDLDCLLNSLEPGGRPWLPGPLMSDGVSRLTSPWSGAPLSLPIFVHACFVWYALLQFWSDAMGVGAAPESAAGLARRAWRGFVLRPDISLRAASGGAISDAVDAAVTRMTAQVIGATDAEVAA